MYEGALPKREEQWIRKNRNGVGAEQCQLERLARAATSQPAV